jgi:GNAT superfamily N-acetyltransferase
MEPTPGAVPDPGGIAVRVAVAAELDAAGDAVRAAYAADGLAGGAYLDVLADARDRSRDATVAVAVSPDDTVLGSVTFTLPGSRWAELSGPGEAEFRALGVYPWARGRGVGRALACWCVDEARRVGASRLVICSLDVMHAAHRLYGTLGFGRRPDLDWQPEPGIRLLGFDLVLDPDGRDARNSLDTLAPPST